MIRTTRSTTLRMTGDIWHRNGRQQLLPSSAFQIADHHLHASGLIEHTGEDEGRLYKHDWFCVSQAADCFPVDGLLQKAMENVHSNIFVLQVGTSSIQFGNTLTLNSELLATTRRVFCRKKDTTGTLDPFTKEEKTRFLEFCPTPSEPKLPELERYAILPTATITSGATSSILSVRVGPQHINFGNHADHAFLAEVAHHALSLVHKERDGLTINYISETFIGDTLECFFYENTIYVTRMAEENGESMLVLIAK